MEINESKETTLFELAKDFYPKVPGKKNVSRVSKPVTEGLVLEPLPTAPGYYYLTPGQIANIRVDLLRLENGKFVGFQRKIKKDHANRMALVHALDPMRLPPMRAALSFDGNVFMVDGDHRGLGAIISRKPGRATIEGPLSKEQMAQFFDDQNRAAKINREHHILIGTLPAEKYLTAAIQDPSHPWASLVAVGGSHNAMSLTTAHEMLQTYVTGKTSRGRASLSPELQSLDWDPKLADELASLLPVIGKRKDRPVAWSSTALRGLSRSALHCVKERGSRKTDIDRWLKKVGSLPWQDFNNLRKATDFERLITDRFNHKLHESNRVPLPPPATSL